MPRADGVPLDPDGRLILPAEMREQWALKRVVVTDRGDHVVIRPAESADAPGSSTDGEEPTTS